MASRPCASASGWRSPASSSGCDGMSDGLLLTRRERPALGTVPSLAIALLPLSTGEWVTATAIAFFGVLCGLGIGSTVRSARGAVGAGIFIALLQLGFDLWLAY